MVELIILPLYLVCAIVIWIINTVSWLFSLGIEIENERLDDLFYYWRMPIFLFSIIGYYLSFTFLCV